MLGADIEGGNSFDAPQTCTVKIFGVTDFQPNAIAALLQRCCSETLAAAAIGFTFSWCCSKPRIGEFGGGWRAVFADRIESGTADEALAHALSL